MQNSPYNLLVALTTTYTTNIITPTSGIYILVKHIRVINKTAVAATFRLFKGASAANAAGSEFVGYDKSVPANDSIDWYGQMKLSSSEYLVGGAGTTTALTLEVDGERGVEF